MAPLSYRIKTHPRARRIRLKVLRDASLEVVTPPGADARAIREFGRGQRNEEPVMTLRF